VSIQLVEIVQILAKATDQREGAVFVNSSLGRFNRCIDAFDATIAAAGDVEWDDWRRVRLDLETELREIDPRVLDELNSFWFDLAWDVENGDFA
jgi:SUKH-4 immunity protein of toxin-antitoxin system